MILNLELFLSLFKSWYFNSSKVFMFFLEYNFIRCQPYFVSTGLETSPVETNENAASSNGIEFIWPLEKEFNLPPLKDEFLSSEYFFAKYSKLFPLFIESEIFLIAWNASDLFLYFIIWPTVTSPSDFLLSFTLSIWSPNLVLKGIDTSPTIVE